MAFKFIIVLTFVAVASAGLIPAQQYQSAQQVYSKDVESYAYPKYQFSYAVNDEHTGDIKNQVESRDGDVVRGEYSLIDSDGYKRVVEYTADHEHGFNAVVRREPLGYAVKAAPVIKSAPVAYAAPALIKSAPAAYADASAFYKSAALSYSAAPAQASYVGQSIVKSAPQAYSDASAYSYSKY